MKVYRYVLLSCDLAAEVIGDTLKGSILPLMGAALNRKRKRYLYRETVGWGCIVGYVVIAN